MPWEKGAVLSTHVEQGVKLKVVEDGLDELDILLVAVRQELDVLQAVEDLGDCSLVEQTEQGHLKDEARSHRPKIWDGPT